MSLEINDDFHVRRSSFAHGSGVWWYVAVVGLGGPFAIFCIVRCGMPGLVCRHPSGHGLCRMSNPEYDFFHMLWHLSSGLGESFWCTLLWRRHSQSHRVFGYETILSFFHVAADEDTYIIVCASGVCRGLFLRLVPVFACNLVRGVGKVHHHRVAVIRFHVFLVGYACLRRGRSCLARASPLRFIFYSAFLAQVSQL